jgi:hypothetical protein
MRKAKRERRIPECIVQLTDEGDLVVFLDGVKIAKRANKAWVPLEPGFEVYDGEQQASGEGTLVVLCNGVVVQ